MIPDQQARIDLEFRLSAIEYMLSKLFGVALKASTLSEHQIDEALDQLAEGSMAQKFPGLDPVTHDMASDEYSRAIKRLTDLTKATAKAL